MVGCVGRNGVNDEFSKCVKFESGLHPETNQFIGYQKIRHFFSACQQMQNL